MMTTRAEQVQVFYEIAMSIGSSLDLKNMTKAALSTYLRKLNCCSGSILGKKEAGGTVEYSMICSIPRTIRNSSVYHTALAKIHDYVVAENATEFDKSLPIVEKCRTGEFFHIMDLPGFGLIILVRCSAPLNPYEVKSLHPLNIKLASACNACLQKEALQESEKKYRTIFEQFQDLYYQTDMNGTLIALSPSVKAIAGYDPQELIGRSVLDVYSNPLERRRLVKKLIQSGRIKNYELKLLKKNGEEADVLVSSYIVLGDDQKPISIDGVIRDITERKQAEAALQKAYDLLESKVEERTTELRVLNKDLKEEILERKEAEKRLKEAQAQLIQSEKLAGVGQLAAGIAHEINTPVQYIGSHVHFLGEAFQDIGKVIQKAREIGSALSGDKKYARFRGELEKEIQEAEMDYLEEAIPESIVQSKEGIKRISDIVQAMKEFAHPGEKEKVPFDINEIIRNTTNIARHEWKYVAEIELDLQEDLMFIPCLRQEIGQVFLNLIINAAYTISERLKVHDSPKGIIKISSRMDKDIIEIKVTDNGMGIPEEHQSRIFEPFFTTKEIG
ncbi:PAS domain S-box protein, partial [bacterium]|nr:PAS domain S-box protein [bacterium]